MIFPNLSLEDVVQTDDLTRLDASRSSATNDETSAISLVEIRPETDAHFIDVTGQAPVRNSNWVLDWQYATDGVKTIAVRVTTDGLPVTVYRSLTVVTPHEDRLFSSDQDLTSYESEILRYLPEGRNTFNNVHRRAQRNILNYLDRRGYTDRDGKPYTKEAVIDLEEVRYWSIYWVLEMLFEDFTKEIGSINDQKREKYNALRYQAQDRSILRLDMDGDGKADEGEQVRINSSRLVRR